VPIENNRLGSIDTADIKNNSLGSTDSTADIENNCLGAVENNTAEAIRVMTTYFPDALLTQNDWEEILKLTVLNHSQKVYSFLLNLRRTAKYAVVLVNDYDDDSNILHLAGRLAPIQKLNAASLFKCNKSCSGLRDMTKESGDTLKKETSTTSTPQFQCPILKTSNYSLWAIRMQIILEANGLWETIEPNEKTQADNKKDKTAIAFLYQALPEEQLLQITKHKRGEQNPKERNTQERTSQTKKKGQTKIRRIQGL
nr:zinc finger, CCHC-type [Tanacetum cinerariifolium]